MFVVCFALTVLMMLISAYTDIASRRIPNWVTLPMIVVGISLNAIYKGTGCIMDVVFIVALFFACKPINKDVGMGDLKLIMATVALMGTNVAMLIFFTAVFICLVGVYANGVALSLTYVTSNLPKYSQVFVTDKKSLSMPFAAYMAEAILVLAATYSFGGFIG